MTLPFANLFRQMSQMRKFGALTREQRSIVFYAENAGSWPHFQPIVQHLTGALRRNVCYLTSDDTDPVLDSGNELLHPFWIGSASVRTAVFTALKADVMVMTMPDLEAFHIKRSRAHPVHYAYVFHSMVSTHMIYRPTAFDSFDTILAVGPHQVREIRAREAMCGLAAKSIVEHGYGRLDTLRSVQTGKELTGCRRARPIRRVLIAPSWGENCILESLGNRVVRVLLDAGYLVTVRPHPETVRRRGDAVRDLVDEFGSRPDFLLDLDVSSADSLEASDVMISDYSGAALEYAFAYERPVISIDLPRKVNNPSYDELGIEPLEVSIRPSIGRVMEPEHIGELPDHLERISENWEDVCRGIESAREAAVFNSGKSGVVGARAIARIADQRTGRGVARGSRMLAGV